MPMRIRPSPVAPPPHAETTAITETKDRLYVQSLHARGLGWLAAK